MFDRNTIYHLAVAFIATIIATWIFGNTAGSYMVLMCAVSFELGQWWTAKKVYLKQSAWDVLTALAGIFLAMFVKVWIGI